MRGGEGIDQKLLNMHVPRIGSIGVAIWLIHVDGLSHIYFLVVGIRVHSIPYLFV